MQIFQIDRFFLEQHIRSNASRIRGTVLDVGAGTVARYRHYFKYEKYIRMDVKQEEGIDVVGSVESIPFPDNTFDSVICTQVLEHVVHPERAMSELNRVLRSGGMLLLTIPQACELHEEPNDFSRFTKYWIEQMAQEFGLEVELLMARGGMFSMISQFLMRYCIDRGSLYHHRIWGAIASHCFKMLGRCAILMDRLDTSVANRKHTLGWLAILTK